MRYYGIHGFAGGPMERGVCKLCLQEKHLVKSHLVPRAVYSYCRAPGLDPVLMTGELVLPTQKQIRSHLLCTRCDGLLSREGEDWTMPLLAEQMGSFGLYELLDKSALIDSDPGLSVYATARLPTIETNKLVHLALGIFWKASVHSWRKKIASPIIELGIYREKIREFLIGESSFPKDMVLILTLTPPPVKYACFTVPRELENEYGKHYFFYLPGLKFDLAIGGNLGEVQELCLHSSSTNVLLVEDLSREIKMVFEVGTKKAKRTVKFRQYAKHMQKLRIP